MIRGEMIFLHIELLLQFWLYLTIYNNISVAKYLTNFWREYELVNAAGILTNIIVCLFLEYSLSLLLDYNAKLSVHYYFDCDEDNEIAGVYADLDFQEGDLVLKDQMLFGVQHSANKVLYMHIIFVCCYASQTLFLCFYCFSLDRLHGFSSISFTFDVADWLFCM